MCFLWVLVEFLHLNLKFSGERVKKSNLIKLIFVELFFFYYKGTENLLFIPCGGEKKTFRMFCLFLSNRPAITKAAEKR